MLTLWTLYERINFITTLLAAEIVVCTRLKTRSHFLWRIIPCIILGIGLSLGLETLIDYYLLINFKTWSYVVLFLISVGIIGFCYKSDVWSIIFACTAGYCAQHMAYQMHMIIQLLSGNENQWLQAVILVATCVVIYAAIYFLFARTLKKKENSLCINYRILMVLSLIIIIVAVFLSVEAVINGAAGNDALQIIICLFSSAACLLGLISLKAMNNVRYNEQEKDFLQHVVNQAKSQYSTMEENIKLINIKCHDIKHKVMALKGRIDSEELEDITSAIEIYDRTFDTGNKALDTVLTEESLQCRQKNIRFTCMLDGTVFNDWDSGDIYSFFNNALDNAVCSAGSMDDDKKTISITSMKGNGVTDVRIENFYQGELKFDDGLPVTSGDTRFHGYGMKSIRLVAENYGCGVSISTQDDIFRLDLLIPC